ncbi:methyltransferase domain-containing protein [Novosphingobium soli]|uniref:Methyltransferase domain-containing protein n=1 Tax=Novosphingobium soli TaxID=574956 RepID=A0ABV6CRS6_9SPHN
MDEQEIALSLGFTGERIVPGAPDCEPTFAQKMFQEHVARYAFAAQLAADADVLDVGCGVGYGSQWLGKAGARSVLGFDISADAIDHARMNYFHPAVSFKVQDATAIEPGDGYDLVTCFELIEHIEEQEHVLDLIKGALREGGVLAISTPRPLDDIRTHFHVHEMSFEELYGLLKARFLYVEPYFQVNCFTSLVGRERPEKLERLVPVSERIDIDHADYFIFLASDSPMDGRAAIQPLLTMNDDAYVLTLEKDVGVLRQAENDHIARIADLEQEKQALAQSAEQGQAISALIQEVSVLRSSVGAFSEMAGREPALSAVQQELAALRGSLSAMADARAELDSVRRSLLETQQRTAEVEHERYRAQAQRDDAEREAASLRLEHARLAADLDAVRRALVEQGAQLAAAQTEVHAQRTDAARLPEAMARTGALESEINALRYRVEYAEATLTRFRRSFSWSITRPLRWVWRTSRKITGRSQPR